MNSRTAQAVEASRESGGCRGELGVFVGRDGADRDPVDRVDRIGCLDCILDSGLGVPGESAQDRGEDLDMEDLGGCYHAAAIGGGKACHPV